MKRIAGIYFGAAMVTLTAPAAAQPVVLTADTTIRLNAADVDAPPPVGAQCRAPAGTPLRIIERSRQVAWAWLVEIASGPHAGCRGFVRATEFETAFDAAGRRSITDSPGRGAPLPTGPDYSAKSRQIDMEEAVTVCKARSGADAYTTPGGSVAWFGTNQQRWAFEKCMQERGVPLSVR